MTRFANDTTRRTVSTQTSNPTSKGFDMASTHPHPFTGTPSGKGFPAGRKPIKSRKRG